MHPLLAPVASSLASSLVLAWVYAHLYRRERRRYLQRFAWAWAADGVQNALGLLALLGAPTAVRAVRLLALLAFAGLFLAGARGFRNERVQRVWAAVLAVAAVASLAAIVAGSDLDLARMLAFVTAGVAVAWAGVELLRGQQWARTAQRVIAGSAVLLGLDILVFPWLRAVPGLAEGGYVAAGTLKLIVAGGTLVLHLWRVERALQEKTQLLSGVLDRSGIYVDVKDLQGRYVFVNQHFADHVKLAPDQLIGRTIRDLAPPDEAQIVEERERGVLATGTPYVGEQTRFGRTYDVSCFPLRDADGKPFALGGTYTDITDRRTKLERSRDAAKSDALGTFARGLVHDMNNLFTVITGHAAELARRYPGDGDVMEIRGALHRGETLARALLAFTSRQRLSPRTVDLGEVVERAQALVQQSVGETVTVEVKPAVGPCRSMVDPDQFETVLAQLAINSREAMPDGGKVEIETALVEISAERAGGRAAPGMYVAVTFRDTGVGMAAETREHMFDPFFTTKPGGLGTGLGLASVFGTVKQSGGFIEVDSAPGKGTEIRILLPYVQAPSDKSSRKLRAATPVGVRRELMVLVVEDDPAVRRVVARTLETNGFSVVQARDGVHGLECAAKIGRAMALVITDVEMPRMGGVEMVEQLAATGPPTPVLFMSGYTDAVDGIARGHADRDFIQKPFEPRALLGQVSALLAGVTATGRASSDSA